MAFAVLCQCRDSLGRFAPGHVTPVTNAEIYDGVAPAARQLAPLGHQGNFALLLDWPHFGGRNLHAQLANTCLVIAERDARIHPRTDGRDGTKKVFIDLGFEAVRVVHLTFLHQEAPTA